MAKTIDRMTVNGVSYLLKDTAAQVAAAAAQETADTAQGTATAAQEAAAELAEVLPGISTDISSLETALNTKANQSQVDDLDSAFKAITGYDSFSFSSIGTHAFSYEFTANTVYYFKNISDSGRITISVSADGDEYEVVDSGLIAGGVKYFAPSSDKHYLRVYNNTANAMLLVQTYTGYAYEKIDTIEIEQNVLNTSVKKIGNKLVDLSGTVFLNNNDFEIGNIGFSSSGFVYTDNTKRVRTKQGVVIKLYDGDIISVADPSTARVAWGRINADGTYTANSEWITNNPYYVYSDAHYAFVIEAIPAATVTNIEDLLSQLVIIRGDNLTKACYDFDNLRIHSVNHKGYSTIAPENTLPAFTLSKVMGFDFIETDVQMTLDNIPVVCHNATIDATSNGTGAISEMTYAQLAQYDFGSWKDIKYAGTKIPKLEEVILLCKQLGLYAYLELKDAVTLTQEQVKIIVDTVKAQGMLRSVVWISFNIDYLKMILAEDKGAFVLYILSTDITAAARNRIFEIDTGFNRFGFDFNYNVAQTHVDWAKERKIPFGFWTVNTTSVMESTDKSAYAITSDNIVYADYLSLAVEELKPLSVYDSRITVSGGYSNNGNSIKISAEFEGVYQADNGPRIIYGLPKPKRMCPVNIVKVNCDDGDYTVVGAYVSTDGVLFIDSLVTGERYLLSADYSLI